MQRRENSAINRATFVGQRCNERDNVDVSSSSFTTSTRTCDVVREEEKTTIASGQLSQQVAPDGGTIIRIWSRQTKAIL
jgi:hypothetical protein